MAPKLATKATLDDENDLGDRDDEDGEVDQEAEGASEEQDPEILKFAGEMEREATDVHSLLPRDLDPRDRSVSEVQRYVQRISQFPRLDPAAEKALMIQVKNGVPGAFQRFANANLRYPVWFAKKYLNRGLTFMELIQVANVGMLEAIKRFKPEKSNRFGAYAIWRMKAEMTAAIGNTSTSNRIPIQNRNQYNVFYFTQERLSLELGREPTLEEVADRMGISLKWLEVLLARHAFAQPISFSHLVGTEGNATLLDLQAAPEDGTIEDYVTVARQLDRLSEVLPTLGGQQRETIELRFGIGRPDELTLQQVADQFGISREGARQIQNRTYDQLRTALESEAF